jgi:hypothetical protein
MKMKLLSISSGQGSTWCSVSTSKRKSNVNFQVTLFDETDLHKTFSLVRKLPQTKPTRLVTLFDETGSWLVGRYINLAVMKSLLK